MTGSSRCIGAVRGRSAGPTVVITGGLHGNEPAGVRAAATVLEELAPLHGLVRGKVVAFTGNSVGLVRGVRFVSRDLNRGWDPPALERLEVASIHELRAEDRDQRELYDAFTALERESAKLVFVDLHTTSGSTPPFACSADASRGLCLARALPVAAVVGLERKVGGTMLSWCADRGHVGISFEAGQHDDPAAQHRHVAAVWTLLVAVGLIDAVHVPRGELHERTLAGAGGRPGVVEVRHRHVVQAEDGFEMLGGFESFDPIEAGQIVARDRHGPVRSPEAGLILMPRYQVQGSDGFFVGREIVRKPS